MASENNKNKEQDKEMKGIGFFKKIRYSIFKIEKYPEMATEGFGKAIGYIAKLVVVLAIILAIWTVYQTYEMINEGKGYVESQFPDFSYKDGMLTVDSQESITIDNERFGKIIIDTNTDSEEEINNYVNEINNYGAGALILKERVILNNITMIGETSYNYKEALESMNLTEFTKQDLINYISSSKINNVYFSIFITLFIYSFAMYFINTLWYAVIISIVGYLAMFVLKMRMRYVALFNMSIYALTLSTILNIIYLLITIFTNFTIEYFSVMYITVATIYLLAAILIINSELIKKQAEVMKIIEAEKIVKKEMKDKEREEKKEEPEDKKDGSKDNEEKEDKEHKKNKGNLNNGEPGESNA